MIMSYMYLYAKYLNCCKCTVLALSFLHGFFNSGGFLVLSSGMFSLSGQGLCSVTDRAEEPLLRLSLHAMGYRGLHDCPTHR